MPTPKKGPRLGGSPAHQRLILSNLATALFEHRRITTTETRARLLRPYAEKLITKAKKAHLGENPLHQRREVLKLIHDKTVVHELFTEIAPTYAERPGGYTRITKIGPRKGDNAPMAVIELVTEAYRPKPARTKRPTPAAAPVAPAPLVEEDAAVEDATPVEPAVAAEVEEARAEEVATVAADAGTGETGTGETGTGEAGTGEAGTGETAADAEPGTEVPERD